MSRSRHDRVANQSNNKQEKQNNFNHNRQAIGKVNTALIGWQVEDDHDELSIEIWVENRNAGNWKRDFGKRSVISKELECFLSNPQHSCQEITDVQEFISDSYPKPPENTLLVEKKGNSSGPNVKTSGHPPHKIANIQGTANDRSKSSETQQDTDQEGHNIKKTDPQKGEISHTSSSGSHSKEATSFSATNNNRNNASNYGNSSISKLRNNESVTNKAKRLLTLSQANKKTYAPSENKYNTSFLNSISQEHAAESENHLVEPSSIESQLQNETVSSSANVHKNHHAHKLNINSISFGYHHDNKDALQIGAPMSAQGSIKSGNNNVSRKKSSPVEGCSLRRTSESAISLDEIRLSHTEEDDVFVTALKEYRQGKDDMQTTTSGLCVSSLKSNRCSPRKPHTDNSMQQRVGTPPKQVQLVLKKVSPITNYLHDKSVRSGTPKEQNGVTSRQDRPQTTSISGPPSRPTSKQQSVSTLSLDGGVLDETPDKLSSRGTAGVESYMNSYFREKSNSHFFPIGDLLPAVDNVKKNINCHKKYPSSKVVDYEEDSPMTRNEQNVMEHYLQFEENISRLKERQQTYLGPPAFRPHSNKTPLQRAKESTQKRLYGYSTFSTFQEAEAKVGSQSAPGSLRWRSASGSLVTRTGNAIPTKPSNPSNQQTTRNEVVGRYNDVLLHHSLLSIFSSTLYICITAKCQLIKLTNCLIITNNLTTLCSKKELETRAHSACTSKCGCQEENKHLQERIP